MSRDAYIEAIFPARPKLGFGGMKRKTFGLVQRVEWRGEERERLKERDRESDGIGGMYYTHRPKQDLI